MSYNETIKFQSQINKDKLSAISSVIRNIIFKSYISKKQTEKNLITRIIKHIFRLEG